jgi:hypothetical protein
MRSEHQFHNGDPANWHEGRPAVGFARRLFDEPADKSVQIWRFMDFTKFVAILQHSGLFFARCDLLNDPFEGSVPRAMREVTLDSAGSENVEFKVDPEDVVAWSEFNKFVRKWTTISCWHMNAHESAAMWKVHAQSNEAVAIVSTYERLRSCLNERRFWIEQVRYINYEKDRIPTGNAMYPVVFKRLSFAHEKELRAFTSELPTKDEINLDIDRVPSSPGQWEHVDLAYLIVAIRVAPKSPSWFVDLVREVSAKYGLHAPVKQSALDVDPVF